MSKEVCSDHCLVRKGPISPIIRCLVGIFSDISDAALAHTKFVCLSLSWNQAILNILTSSRLLVR
jgi:hypothetical protein